MFFLPTRKLLFSRAGLLYHSKSFLFPQLDCVILTTTGKGLSIGTDGHTHNGVFMLCEGTQEVSCLQVPQLDCLITTTTGKLLSIGTDGYTPNVVFMLSEFSHEISCLQVPQLDYPISTTTGKGLPIGTDGYTPNVAFMPCEGTDTMPREIFRRY